MKFCVTLNFFNGHFGTGVDNLRFMGLMGDPIVIFVTKIRFENYQFLIFSDISTDFFKKWPKVSIFQKSYNLPRDQIGLDIPALNSKFIF